MKKVTILIATYVSDEEMIRSKIISLLDQTILSNTNIVILNCQDFGNESMNFRPLCRGHGEDGARVVEVVYHNYIKLYESWNDGIRLTESDYIVNYNMDDGWRPDFLEKCVDFLDKNPDYAVVSSRILTTNVPNQVYGNHPSWSKVDGELPFLPYPESTAGPCPMWRRSLHDKYGYFDERCHSIGDAIMWEKWLAGGERFGLIDEPLTLYYRNPESLERRTENGISLRDRDLRIIGRI